MHYVSKESINACDEAIYRKNVYFNVPFKKDRLIICEDI